MTRLRPGFGSPAPQDPPPSRADMDAMVAEARENGFRAPVLWHAEQTARSGGGAADCPFGEDEPDLRENWLWMFDMVVEKFGRWDVEPPPARPAAGGPKATPAGPHITADGKFLSDRFRIVRIKDGTDASLDKVALSLHDPAAREPLELYARKCADRELGRDLLAVLGAEGR